VPKSRQLSILSMQRHASRKDFSYECAGAWNAFGQLPGVHLWWWGTGEERYQLRTAKEEAIAFMRNVERDTHSEPMTASIGGRIFSLHRLTVTISSSSPGIAEIAARYARDADGHFAEAKHSRDQPYMRIGELTDEAGTPSCMSAGRMVITGLARVSHSPISGGSGSWSGEPSERMPS
jgi:hypothetical protein